MISLHKKAKRYNISSENMKKKELEQKIKAEEDKMKKSIEKYKIKEQIGNKGKDGKTFLVVDRFGYEYAMKTFRKNKSSDAITKEVELQRLCSDAGIAPKIIDVDTNSKFIVMEKMDYHLLDEINNSKGLLSESRQKELLKIFKTLDKVGVLHGDVNLLNYMVKNGKLYIIDFGLSRRLTPDYKKRIGIENVNIVLSLLGFVLKMKDASVSSSSYSYLKQFIPEDKRRQFAIL